MPLQQAVSHSQDVSEATAELHQSLYREDLNCLLFFCSAKYDLLSLAEQMREAFGCSRVVGCTTAGEITPDGYGQGCISAIGFYGDEFAVAIKGVEDLANFSLFEAQSLVDGLIGEIRQDSPIPVMGNTFAVTLLDGLSIQEEMVLVSLNAALGSIPNFGGSAGDDVHLTDTYVYFDGYFRNHAAAVLLVTTKRDFEVFSTHHMHNPTEKLVVTNACPDTRRVFEINAEPAALEYANAIGKSLDELNHKVFALNPIAVKLGDEYFVRSIQQVNEDLSLTFYCAVENGIVLTVVEPGPLIPNLQQEISRIEQLIGTPEMILGCDCFLRRLEATQKGETETVSAFLQANNVVGFNTYGEQMAGRHINQTFTGVAIGKAADD